MVPAPSGAGAFVSNKNAKVLNNNNKVLNNEFIGISGRKKFIFQSRNLLCTKDLRPKRPPAAALTP